MTLMGKGNLACTSYRFGLSLCPPSQLDVELVHPKSPPVPASPQEAHPLSRAPVLAAQLPLPPCPPQQQGFPSTSPTVIKHTGMLTFPLKSIFWVIRNSLFLQLDLQEIRFLERTFSIWGRNRRVLGVSLSL